MTCRYSMHKRRREKNANVKGPTRYLFVTCNCLSFILKVLRPVDENSVEPQSIDRSCSAGASCLSCGKILKKYPHSPQAVARAILEQDSLSKRARYTNNITKRSDDEGYRYDKEDLREVSSSDRIPES